MVIFRTMHLHSMPLSILATSFSEGYFCIEHLSACMLSTVCPQLVSCMTTGQILWPRAGMAQNDKKYLVGSDTR